MLVQSVGAQLTLLSAETRAMTTRHATVLLIDDDPCLLELRGILTEAGHDVHTAPNAEDAQKHLDQHTYDAILMELRLPGMNGLEFLRLFRARTPPSPTAVIILTGHPDGETINEALRQGAYAYVAKPVSPELLCSMIAQVVETRYLRAVMEKQVGSVERDLEVFQEDVDRLHHTVDEVVLRETLPTSPEGNVTGEPEQQVLVASTRDVVRKGLRQIVTDSLRARVVEAKDWPALLSQVRSGRWDIIVLDMDVGGRSTAEMVEELKQRGARAVIVLCRSGQKPPVRQLLDAGVAGCLIETCDASHWMEAMTMAREGGVFVCPELADLVAGGGKEEEVAPEHLSPRQLQVLCEIAAGKSVGEIADEAGVSGSTIRSYRTGVLQRLGLKTDVDLVRYALSYGLLE